MAVEKEPVFSRWSRLKRGENVADPDTDESVPAPPEDGGESADGEAPGAAGDASAGEEMLTEADLPDIEALDYNSDFSAFLQKNVPLHLHKKAMRKLWTSDPVLANLDGLNDYDLDYSIKEAMEIAAESAADLARGTKRLNLSDQRMREREEARAEAAARKAESARRPEAASDSANPAAGNADGEAEGAGEEIRISAEAEPEKSKGEA